MNQRRSFGFSIALFALALAAGAVVVRQWQETVFLQSELQFARMDVAEFSRLQSENARWRERQISAAELETLRADHAALTRLRAELEALEKRATAAPP